MEWLEILEAAGYDEEQAACIASKLEGSGIATLMKFQNSPIQLGASVCGCDVYALVERVTKVFVEGIEESDEDADRSDLEDPLNEVNDDYYPG